MQETASFEMLVLIYQTTRPHTPEDRNLNDITDARKMSNPTERNEIGTKTMYGHKCFFT